MSGMFLDGYKNPAIRAAAEQYQLAPIIYYIGCALATDLKKLPENTKISPNKPLDLYNTVGVIGEVPVHESSDVPAVITGILSLIESFEDDEAIGSSTILAQTLLNGLQMGYLNESTDPTLHPWAEGQKQIAQVLIDYLAQNRTEA